MGRHIATATRKVAEPNGQQNLPGLSVAALVPSIEITILVIILVVIVIVFVLEASDAVVSLCLLSFFPPLA